MRRRSVILYNIVILFFLYFLIACLFSVVYIMLEILQWGYVIDHYSTSFHQAQPLDLITRSLYFSVITMLAVGYGDVTPFGLSKGVAMIQAFVGYILPYAMILNYLIFNPGNIKASKRKYRRENRPFK
ncbi:ion channel [Dethiobacter alkaliphilus]|uniref:Ion transport 2 domain protein n=1 Tax=Dethiobacter alkaliphilus AHT 1 TaxID=555088 RepID=C0GFH8_DETAL|nr:ion channel [Dethiobacter alkaliphilus]EEG77938.1 Ion transport 2 domain protein [Dethiobacter alkaliphilus AHT 1]